MNGDPSVNSFARLIRRFCPPHEAVNDDAPGSSFVCLIRRFRPREASERRCLGLLLCTLDLPVSPIARGQ